MKYLILTCILLTGCMSHQERMEVERVRVEELETIQKAKTERTKLRLERLPFLKEKKKPEQKRLG